MTCCSTTCRRWTLATFSVVFLILGILAAAGWKALFNKIVRYEFSLVNKNTIGYKMWKETPVPIYLQFYMFDWKNPEDVQLGLSKPHFEQIGPYTFEEKHYRTNVKINDNDTVTYYNKRVWHFVPEMTNGSLDDMVTTLNPLISVIAKIVEPKHIIVRRGVNFFSKDTQSQLAVTKSVGDFIFNGYQDDLLDIARRLNLKDFKIPFDKFGWFYTRNESVEADGVYNMENGGHGHSETLGIVDNWNYESITSYYSGECGRIKGTTGEYWYPTKDDPMVDVFSPDICGSLTLEKNGTASLHGITGNVYYGTDRNFDNGTKYPEMKCYLTPGQDLLSGVRNITLCQYNAPAYFSYPHFFEADPSYKEAVSGLSPNSDLHRTALTLEPSLGLPMKIDISIQVNLLLDPVEGIDVLANVSRTMFPMFWFKETAELSESLASEAKFLLVMPDVGYYLGYAFIVIGCILLSWFIYLLYKNDWSMRDKKLNRE